MPGRDGTGPTGKGPMAGRGMGYCILKISDEHSTSVQGFAGLSGKPVILSREDVKEVFEMPAGNRTGPLGLGPMTGRAAGYCAGFTTPGYVNPIRGPGFRGRGAYYGSLPPAYSWGPYAPIRGRRFLRGFGRGLGRGRRRGRGGVGYAW